MKRIVTTVILAASTLNLITSTQATAKPKKDVYYANCSDAKADGAAPLHKGDPGYRSGLDRDGDGVACE